VKRAQKIGRARRFGLVAFAAALVIDQAHKLYMLGPYDMEGKGRVALAPFLDLVMVWNTGVSYGLFDAFGEAGRWVLTAIGIGGAAVFLALLWRSGNALAAIALGLIAGGALGNAIDRIAYGAVADFFLLHAGDFEWYVFNLADVAIVAGVVGLLIAWAFERPENAQVR